MIGAVLCYLLQSLTLLGLAPGMYVTCVGRNGDVHGVLQVDAPPHGQRRQHRLHLARARLGVAPRAGGAQGGSNIS